MLDKLDAEFAFGREALDVRAYRQEILSSNVANADSAELQGARYQLLVVARGRIAEKARR